MPTTPAAFLVDANALDGARAGDALTLDGEEGRHAAKAARLAVGEQLLLSDAPGRQARAEVTAAHKESLELRLLADPSPAAPRTPRLTLVQALATGGRDEQAVETATELGVDAVIPWIAGRSVSVWRGEKLRKGRARWESAVRAAVKQSRRPGIPTVEEPAAGRELTARLLARIDTGALVLVLHEQESTPLLSLAAELRGTQATEIVVVVGPEGGIAEQELEDLRALGARSVLLGPEVLRSSTAGPAALVVLSALLGRWG